jgi:hypothetical protein
LIEYRPAERGTDLSIHSQAQLDQVALRLNQRPRKTLGFETPASRIQASVASTPELARITGQVRLGSQTALDEIVSST